MNQIKGFEKLQKRINRYIKEKVREREQKIEAKDKEINLGGGKGGKNTFSLQMEKKLKERKEKIETMDRKEVEEVKNLLEAHSPDPTLNPCGSLREALIKQRKQIQNALEKRRKQLRAS